MIILKKWQETSLFPEKYDLLIKKGFSVEKDPAFNSYVILRKSKKLDLGSLSKQDAILALQAIYEVLN